MPGDLDHHPRTRPQQPHGFRRAGARRLAEVRASLGLGATTAGFVTSLPCLCFALVGAVAVAVSRRIGVTAGILLGPRAVAVGAAARGLGLGLPAAIESITARTRDPRVTAQVSGFVQPIGYLIAALGPVLVGIVHEPTGGWTAVLVLLMGTGLVMVAAGLVLARGGQLDDEIALPVTPVDEPGAAS